MFKRLLSVLSMLLVAATLSIVPAFAANSDNHGHNNKLDPATTTLDACGYFGGTQTAVESYDYTKDGITYHTEKGTWTGVTNNYNGGPVASLGTVTGSYKEDYTISPDGTITGTEQFNSGAGKIDQTFTIKPSIGSFVVSVTATRDLSFLTSDTNGHCYIGPFPRP